MPIITLTTDFGTKDWFVGTMKGVILAIAPRASIIDITHDVPVGDIRSGAFALAASYGYFPRGTIHLAIVDPGVGSRRKAVAVQTGKYLFVGPDNGLLSLALRNEKMVAIHVLENHAFLAKQISQTFHGRDIFAPAAAHLARGIPPGKLGPRLKALSRLPWPKVRNHGTSGEIIYFDHFGNGITNIAAENLSNAAQCHEVALRSRRKLPIKQFYQAVPEGKPLAIIGSTGLLEIAVNGGSARQILKLKLSDEVTLLPSK